MILRPDSAWIGHESFMDWLIATRRPFRFVELGVHTGWSFFAACNAVRKYEINCQCIGVDTFKGDDHTGFYGDEIYHGVKRLLDGNFAGFAELRRMTFDEAVKTVPLTSVDLLHIDGRHDYEDVKHDFETWKDRLFPGATVLFHDICEPSFGVRKFWDEVKQGRPHFEFDHASGLGVLTYRG